MATPSSPSLSESSAAESALLEPPAPKGPAARAATSKTPSTALDASARNLGAALRVTRSELWKAQKRAGRLLSALRLDIPAVIDLTTDEERARGHETRLEFCRRNYAWRIEIYSGPTGGDDDPSWHEVDTSDIDLCIRAAAHIPKLLEQILGKAETALHGLQATRAGIDEMTRRLGAS